MAVIERAPSAQRRGDISDEEWALRVELAACYRVFDLLGWTELIYNHISLRIPGPEEHLLINPFGLRYREVTASNLVKVDLEGRIIGPSEHPVNPAGIIIHTAIHRARPDVQAVMHTHTSAGSAIASLDCGLDWNTFYGAQLYGQIAYHEFEGTTLDPDEQSRLLSSLGDGWHLMLRNHGLLACGESIPAAFLRLWTLERACQIQLAAMSTGRPLRQVAPEALRRSSEDYKSARQDGLGVDAYLAFVREVDERDPSYRY
jgi:ribulose-5-phosphate 4-epimerase/fuculose-1-phosphate aldolase